ncbi:RNA-directed DNA polymerase (reverse transcriptase)-related family protein [Striga hermonthica]|uniref:RNA-directed DNA polymerase (Reverse transcriptase)-related family protein n=1 Tax=Striga hermonthica TaxID=68872 RepID=A0A9N7RFZ2_STRHE|nr:RNA-directed DNA polymerase (reverse transcriptase)-related family protein [Striga hermonthica]
MQILWNGVPGEDFRPSRGVRQSERISLYLFVLCIERLAHNIQRAINDGAWRLFTVGVVECKFRIYCFRMIYFYSLKLWSIRRTVREVLANFCHDSGLRVSEPKTTILLSKNVHHVDCHLLSTMLGFTRVEDLGYYLGVSILYSRVKRQNYDRILERAETRLSGWKAASLSLAGRVVLTQAVLSTLPYYTMQSIRLPNSICEGLEQCCRRFLWEAPLKNAKLA